MRELDQPSNDLAQHVGDRLWVYTKEDGSTIFGVIYGAS
jgi:hypothetical protein